MKEPMVKYSLILTPIAAMATPSAAPENWLENDDASLLPKHLEDNAIIDQDGALDQHSTENNSALSGDALHGRTHTVNQLQIETRDDGQYVLVQAGKQILLQDNDVIQLGQAVALKVSIQDETLLPYDDTDTSSHRYAPPANVNHNDIWGNIAPQRPSLTTTQSANRSAPNNTSKPNNWYGNSTTTQHDPLAFLGPAQHHTSLNNALPSAPAHSNTPALPYGLGNDNTGLSLTGVSNHYQPTAAQKTPYFDTIPHRDSSNTHNSAQNNEGNILNDLGINEQANTRLINQTYGEKRPLTDQSPMDMLDEYLTEPQASNQSYQTFDQPRYADSNTRHGSLNLPKLGLLKKLLK